MSIAMGSHVHWQYVQVALLKATHANTVVCAQVIKQSLMLKHTGVYNKGLWLNSTELLREITVFLLQHFLPWPTTNAFLKASHGLFSYSSE